MSAKQVATLLSISVAFAALPAIAGAALIPVPNGDFETDAHNISTITSWTEQAGDARVFDAGGSSGQVVIEQAGNTAFTVRNDVAVGIAPSTSYTVTYDYGNVSSSSSGPGVWTVELGTLNGGTFTSLKTHTITASNTTTNHHFGSNNERMSAFSFTTSDSVSGDNLALRASADGGVSFMAFDDFTLAADAVGVVELDNIDLPTPDTAGAQASFVVQSFTPNVAAIGTNDTVTANLPLTSVVFLDTASFLRAPAGTATGGLLYIDVYEGDGDDGTYLGSSTNALDVNNAALLSELTWTFDGIGLDSSLEHALVFSTDPIAGSSVLARLTAANNGGGFVDTYTGGTADNNGDNSSPVPFDTRFAVTFTTPEPSTFAMLGLGLLGLGGLGHRRRRKH